MKHKFLSFFVLFFLLTSVAFAASFTSIRSGNWNAELTWNNVTSFGASGSGDGQFDSSNGIGTDSSGNIYIFDTTNSHIQKFDYNGNFVLRWGSTGTAESQFAVNSYANLTVDSLGYVYVADTGNNRIEKFDSSGNFVYALGWGVSDGSSALQVCTSGCRAGTTGNGNGQFDSPMGLITDPSNNLYVLDFNNGRVQKFSSAGAYISKFSLQYPIGNNTAFLALDSVGNIYTMGLTGHSFIKYDSSGNFVSNYGWGVIDGSNEYQICSSSCLGGLSGTGDGEFGAFTASIVIDSSDNIYVLDTSNGRIEKFDSNGNFLLKWNVEAYGARIALDPDGNILYAHGNTIYKYDSTGSSTPLHVCSSDCASGTDYPGVSDSVTIANGINVTIPDSYTMLAGSLIINSGGTVTLGLNSNVIHYGSFSNNGTLTIGSGATIKQALVPILTSTNNDNITTVATPSFSISCASGATVNLLTGRIVVASGTCLNSTVSLTSTELSVGVHEFTVQETDADGTRVAGPNISTLDSGGEVGFGPSQGLGTDGFSRIAYYDYTNGALKYARCLDADCSTKNVRTIDPNAHTDQFGGLTSLVVGTDGFARIAYGDVDSAGSGGAYKSLKYIVCNDSDCSSPTISTVDTPATGKAGKMAILALDSSNNPFIVYHRGGGDASGGKLMLARYVGSGGTGCTGNSAWKCTIIDTGIQFPSMVLGLDGFARISYDKISNPWTTDTLTYAQCTNLDCTTKNITTVDNSVSSAGFTSSLVVGSDGFALIAYEDNTNGTLKFAKCLNADCSSANLSVLDNSANPKIPSILLDSKGFPRVAYNSRIGTSNFIKYALCADASCVSKSILTLDLDNFNWIGDVTTKSQVLDSNDLSRIVYYDNTNHLLKYARFYPTTVTITEISIPSSTPTPPPANGPIVGSNVYIPNTPGAPLNPNQLFPGQSNNFINQPIVTPTPKATSVPPPWLTTPEPPVPINTQVNISSQPFNFALGTNSVSPEVKSLQKILNQLGYNVALSGPGSPGNETSKFGKSTREALQRFQCKELSICSGDWSTTGYGNLGPRTREKINSLIKR